jgi:hypothetical protein
MWNSGIAGENVAPIINSHEGWIGLNRDTDKPMPEPKPVPLPEPVPTPYDPRESIKSIEEAANEILEHVRGLRKLVESI